MCGNTAFEIVTYMARIACFIGLSNRLRLALLELTVKGLEHPQATHYTKPFPIKRGVSFFGLERPKHFRLF